MSDKKSDPPKRSAGDAVHAVAKAGLSALPAVGGPAAELFQAIVRPPLDRRRDEWMKEVGERLIELEEGGLKLEGLKENEQFISAAVHVTQLAIKTHVHAKRIALRNALMNVAQGKGPSDTLQHMFFDLIDTFTELHIRVLGIFQAPRVPQGVMVGGLNMVIETSLPDLRGQRELYDQVWRDLWLRGLVNTESLHVTMTGHGLGERRTTGLGQQFLEFISAND